MRGRVRGCPNTFRDIGRLSTGMTERNVHRNEKVVQRWQLEAMSQGRKKPQAPEEFEPPYLQSWLDYRFRCGLLSIVLAFAVPLQILLLIFCHPPSFTISVFFFPWLTILSLVLSHFRCPCCKAYFFGSRWIWTVGAAQCRNCGLPTYTLNAEGSPKLSDFDPED